MNLNMLYTAEKDFFKQYPNGFGSEEMKDIKRKHNFDKIVTFTHDVFSKEAFKHKKQTIENIKKFVSKSSMVSVFEKMRFRDFVKEIDDITELELLDALYELIHGNEEEGFNHLVDLLGFYKLAKWPLVSCYLAYFRPTKDVFIKPTTVKRIIKHFEIETISYHSKPTYDFYKKYREIINEIKVKVDSSLSPSNAAFSGFLMMTLP